MAMDMGPVAEREVLSCLLGTPTLEEIVAFHLSEDACDRFYELVDISRERALDKDEQREIDVNLYLEHFIRMLKIGARLRLQQQSSV